VDRVILAGKRAAELTYQMLAYSGKGKFKSKVLNVAESIREIADLLHVSLSKKARIHYDFADNLPTVEADPAQLSQVVLNLVTNANEALGGSSGEIHVRAYPLDADEAFLAGCVGGQRIDPGSFVCIEIRDTGCGMDEQTRERIFEPFYTTKFTGRGLGLSAVLGIVHSHRGAIRIESAPRKGTSALVLLPATHDAETRKVPAESHDGFSGGGLVLLADDEEVVRAVTRAQLEALGFEIHEAHDGAEALSLFETHKYRLAVLDLTMPKMDGDAVARHLQESEPNLPVLLVSGYSAHELTGPLAESPNVRMLAKPFTLEDLRTNLQPLLASAPGTQNPPRPGNP
jgi:two-component system cell cycle sensor histidine kinase/response regulator CckA